MPLNPSLVFNAISFDTPNLELIKTSVIAGKYVDAGGFEWVVTSHDMNAVNALQHPINFKGYSSHVDTKNNNASCLCFGLYWLRARDFADISLEFMFNNAIITFSHKHDLHTRIATRHGKPNDLSRYTKDKSRRTAALT